MYARTDAAYYHGVWCKVEVVILAAWCAVMVELGRRETEVLDEVRRYLTRFSVGVAGGVFAIVAVWTMPRAGTPYDAFLGYRAALLAALAFVAAIVGGLDLFGILNGRPLYRRAVLGLALVLGLTSGWITVPQWEMLYVLRRVAFISIAAVLTFGLPPAPPTQRHEPPG